MLCLQGWGEPLDGDWRPLIRRLSPLLQGAIQLKQGQPFSPKALKRPAHGFNTALFVVAWSRAHFPRDQLPLAGLGPLKLREEIRQDIIPGKPRYQASSGHTLHASSDLASEKRPRGQRQRRHNCQLASVLVFPASEAVHFFFTLSFSLPFARSKTKKPQMEPPVPCYVGHAPLELCVLVDPLGLDDLASSIPGCAPGFKRSSGCLTRN